MHEFNDRWMFTVDYSLFGFGSLRSIDIDFSNPATQDSSLVQNWRDAAIYSGGFHFKATDAVTLRAGYVYNESPVTNAMLRTPRIPDSNRRWITAGGPCADPSTTAGRRASADPRGTRDRRPGRRW
jgi:long-chain fatty acid transport protein